MKLSYSALLTLCSDEISDSKLEITDLNIWLYNIFTILNQLKHNHTKRGMYHSLFNFLFGTSSSAKEITAIENNMEILKGNQDILNSEIPKTFNFVTLTYAETDTNRLFLKLLQKDIIEINSTVHHLSKELKALIDDRNFFIIMSQLRNHLVTLCNGIHSIKIDILSILNQVSVISSQKLAPALLNPLDLISLMITLETQLVSHPRLTLSQCNGENI